ncbi:MAG: acyl-CoA thioesterase domain-containing protein [Actinomycetota bacterium]|nr:acyl-CoA thioesterase domain-containing protein [Actinomycetota bacterium]
MAFDVPDFATLMALESHGPDVYVGISPEYPWGRVYGGQVVAQGLRAAQATVDDGLGVHSLHAYFIRGGTSDEPIRYEVDRIRNGRSFATRRVVARQSDGAILNLACSFQVVEDQADIQEAVLPDDAGRPGSGTPEDWELLGRRVVHQSIGRAAIWLRVLEDLGDDPAMQACALAYTSDDIPTNAAASTHPRIGEVSDDSVTTYGDVFIGASLDHAIWFHRPPSPDEWLFHDLRSHGWPTLGGWPWARCSPHRAYTWPPWPKRSYCANGPAESGDRRRSVTRPQPRIAPRRSVRASPASLARRGLSCQTRRHGGCPDHRAGAPMGPALPD